MANKITELFGYSPDDQSHAATSARQHSVCPFLGDGTSSCSKEIGDKSNRIKSGVCSLADREGEPVIVCPIRLYANNYQLLSDVAKLAFKADHVTLIKAHDLPHYRSQSSAVDVVVFGKGWGGELRVPGRIDESVVGGPRANSFFVDWVLARIDEQKNLVEFAALEVQTMDTIGSYREERSAHLSGAAFSGKSAGINWENVNKRILPQLIYKGHLLEREALCNSGLFFACPDPVYKKIIGRLGESLAEYPLKNNALTFCTYDLGDPSLGCSRPLVAKTISTTTVHQVQLAFSSPKNLPPAGAYEKAIRDALVTTRGKRKTSPSSG
ncbi:MAG: NotI family restriction endonuclease [Casimicrobium sp.]